MKPEDTYTLERFINSEAKTSNTGYSWFSVLELLPSGNPMLQNMVLNDYMDEIRLLCRVIALKDNEYYKYKYNPDLLAYDIYGTTQLGFMVLIMNGITSPKDFNFKRVKMLTKEHLELFISSVYNSEKATLEANKEKVLG
jgi:hypothetical protein